MKTSLLLKSIVATGALCLFLPAASIAQKTKTKTKPKNEAEAGAYQMVLDNAYSKNKDLKEGKNADYIKELARVDPNVYEIALVTTDGQIFTKGDLSTRVSIQSISKVFTLARVLEEQGPKAVMDKIGVDATGLKFNSIVAVEKKQGKDINPFVNPGAIAATSMVSGADSATKWRNIMQTYNDFAGTELPMNWPVYVSEAGDNLRNQAIAHLLFAYGRMYFNPVQATDVYTKQCAVNVNAKDLAVMAATLANGGTNPVTKKKCISPQNAAYVMAVMSTAGLYDNSGQWLFRTGLPAKSGVGGGIIAVCPGKFGIAVISPPLDEAGNSVKAQRTIEDIVNSLKANPYLVEPMQ